MTYEIFRDELLRKLEEKADISGYSRVKFYPDGFTSKEPEELSTIRDTNIRYYKKESDILSGDFVMLFLEDKHSQICRLSCRGLYKVFGEGGWENVWTNLNETLATAQTCSKLDIMELLEKNEYELLRDKIFIRPLNYSDHRYELKENVCRQTGDIVLVLYMLASDERIGGQHNVMSIKVPRVMMEGWEFSEEEVWENAMNNTYMMSPPRMYTNPLDMYHPPYCRGAFMALGSDIKSLSATTVPTVTTTTQMNGAIAMFYPGVRERVAELFGDDYYVAFTSIHEAKLHKKGTMSPRMILGCLKDTNRAFDPTEILSRKVYLYERETGELKQLEL